MSQIVLIHIDEEQRDVEDRRAPTSSGPAHGGSLRFFAAS